MRFCNTEAVADRRSAFLFDILFQADVDGAAPHMQAECYGGICKH